MKARIKTTGEIVKLAESARITLDMCDSYGNPIELNPEDVELISDDNEDASTIDWNQVRVQASIGAMQVLLGKGIYSYNVIAENAAGYANSLVENLKKTIRQ